MPEQIIANFEEQIVGPRKLSKMYGICSFAFDGCEDAKDPDIFDYYCDKNFRRCSLRKEKLGEIKKPK